MARPLRLDVPGAVYHVTARGNERRAVFRDDEDRDDYLARLSYYRSRFGFRLLAYCLMTNHVHLAIRRGLFPLSRVMACLHSSYTQSFNRRHGRVGHLFQGRYKSFLVQEDRYLVALIRYIHLNPVRARIVEKAADYRWCSDRSFRSNHPPPWLDVDDVLPSFGPTRRSALRRYLALMDAPPAESEYEALRAVDQVVKGDEVFALTRFEQVGELAPPLRGLSENRVIEAVSRSTGVAAEDLAAPTRGGAVAAARHLAAYVAFHAGGISKRRMARRFHLDDSSLARPVSRLESQLASDVKLRARVEGLIQALQATGFADLTDPALDEKLRTHKTSNQD